MSGHDYSAATCQWRHHAPAGTFQLRDSVTLCTAQARWVVVALNGPIAELQAPDRWTANLHVHVGHLDHIRQPGQDNPDQAAFDFGDAA